MHWNVPCTGNPFQHNLRSITWTGTEGPELRDVWRSRIDVFVAAPLLAMILALWIVGVVKLFQKRRRVLAWISLAGIIIPFILPIGFVGWFIRPNPQVAMKPSD